MIVQPREKILAISIPPAPRRTKNTDSIAKRHTLRVSRGNFQAKWRYLRGGKFRGDRRNA
jgi:hypothetical protein